MSVVATVSAERLLPAAPEVVFAFLAELANHRQIADRYLYLQRLSPDQRSAWIVISAPLGLRRTARTVLTSSCAPEWLAGTAAVGSRTQAQVRWNLESRGAGTRVALTATVLNAGGFDRLLLACGGQWWLRRCFQSALGRLAQAVGGGAARDAGSPSPSPCDHRHSVTIDAPLSHSADTTALGR
jgi:hypothetical protein